MAPPRKRKRGAKDIPISLSNLLPIGTDVRRVVHNHRTRMVMQPLLPFPAPSSSTGAQPILSDNDTQKYVYEPPSIADDEVPASGARSWKVSLTNSLQQLIL